MQAFAIGENAVKYASISDSVFSVFFPLSLSPSNPRQSFIVLVVFFLNEGFVSHSSSLFSGNVFIEDQAITARTFFHHAHATFSGNVFRY